MKWASVTKGQRARKRNVSFTPLDRATPLTADLRLLDGGDHGEVLAYAAAYANRFNGQAIDGDERYDYGKAIKTVLLTLTDSDSTDDSPKPYFDSEDELFDALDRDRILALANEQRFFQDVTSPFQFSMSNEEFSDHVATLVYAEEGAESEHPFVKWRPALQLSFARSLAHRLLLSLERSSPTISDSAPAGS